MGVTCWAISLAGFKKDTKCSFEDLVQISWLKGDDQRSLYRHGGKQLMANISVRRGKKHG